MKKDSMKELCVFDLDGTLIAHDTFARLVKVNLFRKPSLLLTALKRRVGFINRAEFARKAEIALSDILNSQLCIDRICNCIQSEVIESRLALMREWKKRGATTILLSASPAAYVVPLGKKLGFDQSFGSTIFDGKFRHLHGNEKRRFVDQNFPTAYWKRAFAIADDVSDRSLLETFEKYEWVD
jgi:phosphoserine phosphatase